MMARPRGRDGGPGQAEIPQARMVDERVASVGGPEGRSRLIEVGAA